MQKLKAWLSAARLRTLPLSISGIIVATAIAIDNGYYNGVICALALATTLGLQILSNFANDYGDGVKGTDNEDRVGPQRALQSGVISPKQMFRGIVLTSLITLGLAVALIYAAFGKDNFGYSLFFFALGIVAIAAAIKYTVGNSAYGYRGLGDVFVFLFFGLVSVIGCYFLYGKQLYWQLLFPASAIGMLSSAVLNLNNMRDQESDAKAGKNTLVVKLGNTKARKYHFLLLFGSMFAMLLYAGFTYQQPQKLVFLLAFIPIVLHAKIVKTNKDPKKLDPELKKVALSTFLLAVLLLIGVSL